MTKVYFIVATIAALFVIVTGLNTCFDLNLPGLLPFNRHKVVRISEESRFSIEAIKTSRGVVINSGDSFSCRFEIPLSARGTTQLPDSEKVWVLLADQAGGYYLQNPPVAVRSGRWVATGIRPLKEIKRVIFVRADAESNRFFLSKVRHGEWGKFHPMPNGASEVAFVDLE